tara:strand:- start:49 stop:510 length:462 start_codon:yes stop_codon:yes gene_type:complete
MKNSTQVLKAVTATKKVATKKVAERVTPKKKAVKKSESVILKTQVNNNWKDATRSLSALVKYCNGEGKSDIQKMLDATNKKEGTKVNIKQVANIKNITRLATERELNYNLNPDKTKGAKFVKGEQKRLFSLWLVLLTIGRLAKEEKLILKAVK